MKRKGERIVKRLLSAAEIWPSVAARSAHFRSSATDPGKLSVKDEGLWYTVPEETVNSLQMLEKYEMLDTRLKEQIRTFGKLELMARRPLLDMINILDNHDWRKPNLRFIVHGLPGTGKATTLSQLAQVGIARGWTLLYFPNCMGTVRPKRGIAMSTWKSGRIDSPLETADWLARFKLHNAHVLSTLRDLQTSADYTWSKRESTPAGSSLLQIVEVGIAQPARADDAAAILLKEIRLAASVNKLQVLVLAARVNALYVNSRVKREDGSFAPAGDLSMCQSIRKMLRNDWSGGVVAATTDPVEMLERLERPPNTPVSLLMAQGFHDLEPFVPIHVENYSAAEAESFLQFCEDHNWITVPEAKSEPGRTELCYIAGFNPAKLESIVAPL